MRYPKYGTTHEEAIVMLVSINGAEVLRSNGMLGPVRHNTVITLFISMIIVAAKLAIEIACVFPP